LRCDDADRDAAVAANAALLAYAPVPEETHETSRREQDPFLPGLEGIRGLVFG
jgi:hypothetical protein